MEEIEKYISEKHYEEAIQSCILNNLNNLGLLLGHVKYSQSEYILQQIQTKEKIVEELLENSSKNLQLLSEEKETINTTTPVLPLSVGEHVRTIRVKLLCNWTSSENLRDVWNRMSKGNYTWNNIKLVNDNDPDFFVVCNSPPSGVNPEPSKTIVFRMEPFMGINKSMYGEWATPDQTKFFKVCYHDSEYNNNEWHLSKTYNQLKSEVITKNNDLDNVLSTVLSSKYHDQGHIKRIDFVKFLESKNFPVHVFGDNKWGYINYKGSLPYLEKDNAMFPYKYVFNVENNSIKNYYTEKLIDGILAECLVFYSGCYNVKEFIDEKAFFYLELSNFEEDYKKVTNAIKNNLWEERLPYIKKAKAKILDYLQFFPRLERIINKTENKKYEEQV